jgi:formamidopyrimidine-DNA glycosylase
MPELPEVETARRLIADEALSGRITGVDDSDTFTCRPHAPGELRAALTGRTLTAARRRGKTMWCETSEGGPDLGIHLGMGGRIVVTADGGRLALFDKRRLGRVRLNPDIDALGPDAAEVTLAARTDRLSRADGDRLGRALVSALESAIARGGVHTGDVIASRHPGGSCPRCGAEMRHGTVGGRSTWWCSREQEGAQPSRSV